FRIDIVWKNHECSVFEVGVNWSFPTVELEMDTVSGFRDIEQCVPVRVVNFESVTSFQISLNWDEDLLDFTAIKNIHPTLEPYFKVGDITTSEGQNKIIIELPGTPVPLTLPDSAILFEWCGKPLADPGQSVEMNFTDAGPGSSPQFTIHGLKTTYATAPGGIIAQ